MNSQDHSNHMYKLEAKLTRIKGQESMQPHLDRLSSDQLMNLQQYLQHRLKLGRDARNQRLPRMIRTDRLISTWLKHNEEDSKRLRNEELTGRQTSVAGNMPLMASSLEDLTAFYADTLAPQSNPFISTSVKKELQDMIARLGRDVQARNYYGEVTAAARSLIKYNIGGVAVRWDVGSNTAISMFGIQGAGNSYTALPMHNTFWDTGVTNPKHVSARGEWAAYLEITNRSMLMRRAIKGELFKVDRFINKELQDHKNSNGFGGAGSLKMWFNPSRSIPTVDGSDIIDSDGYSAPFEWADFGLSIPSDSSMTMQDQFELTYMYCWIIPHQHGFLSADDRADLIEKGIEPTTYMELWQFELVNNYYVVSAKPHSPRDRAMLGESPVIPMFMSHLIEDDLGSAQRAHMELIAGFQRMSSSVFAMGIEALRKDVFGHTFVDPAMFDSTKIEAGMSNGVHISKTPGRDVRSGFGTLSGGSNAGQAFGYVGEIMGVKNNLFPSQALPAQVAGLDRAVTNQVSSIIHGAQRGLRMSLRLVDQSVFLPARIETARNLSRFEEFVAAEIDDETIAKELGSGIESLESERITEALWRLTMAIIQSQEGMQAFDVAKIFGYLAQVLRVNEDFSQFVRQAPAQSAPAQSVPGAQQIPPQA